MRRNRVAECVGIGWRNESYSGGGIRRNIQEKDCFGNIASVSANKYPFAINDELDVLNLTKGESVPKYFTNNPSDVYQMKKSQFLSLLEEFAKATGTSLLKISDGCKFGFADGKPDFAGVFTGDYINSQFPKISIEGGNALVKKISDASGSGGDGGGGGSGGDAFNEYIRTYLLNSRVIVTRREE